MEAGSVKSWSFLPWACGALLLAGPFASAANAPLFYRSMLLVAVLIATGGSIAAARGFERGDLLFTTWAVLASGYVLLTVRYVLRLLVTAHVMEMPVMFDRVILIVHNLLVPVALWLFVRSWRKTGLAGPMSRAASVGSTLAGFAVALAIGAFPLIHGLHNTDPALLVSTLGDMISIALIVPLLMPALGMRGGLLMYTWLYLASAQVVWLIYDIWAVARPRNIVPSAWGLAIDQALRVVALLYIYSAAAAQRRALAQAQGSQPRFGPQAVLSESPTPS
jgi:hypothetical protein